MKKMLNKRIILELIAVSLAIGGHSFGMIPESTAWQMQQSIRIGQSESDVRSKWGNPDVTKSLPDKRIAWIYGIDPKDYDKKGYEYEALIIFMMDSQVKEVSFETKSKRANLNGLSRAFVSPMEIREGFDEPCTGCLKQEYVKNGVKREIWVSDEVLLGEKSQKVEIYNNETVKIILNKPNAELFGKITQQKLGHIMIVFINGKIFFMGEIRYPMLDGILVSPLLDSAK